MERKVTRVNADIVGNVWKLLVSEGHVVSAGDAVAVLETMKMEIPVNAPVAGRVSRILVNEGETIQEGDTILELVHG